MWNYFAAELFGLGGGFFGVTAGGEDEVRDAEVGELFSGCDAVPGGAEAVAGVLLDYPRNAEHPGDYPVGRGLCLFACGPRQVHMVPA